MIHRHLDDSIQSFSMSNCSSMDSFQFEGSGSFSFLAAYGTTVDGFDAIDDLAIFDRSQDFPQCPSDCADSAPIETMQQVSSVPTRETKVKFSIVETRSYGIVIGDNPCCPDDLPISLDWKYNPQVKIEQVEEEDMVDISHYPAQRMSYFDRKRRLLEVSGIKVDDKRLQKATNISRREPEIVRTPKCLVSQAA